MSKSITIRDVPLETRDELAARAARSGQSLQEYLRLQLVALSERPDPEALLARVRQRKAQTGSRLAPGKIVGYLEEGRLDADR